MKNEVYVERIRKVFATNTSMYRTSDGYFTGQTIIDYINVYIKDCNISEEQALVIFKLIKKRYRNESNSRINGPDYTEMETKFCQDLTEDLVNMLGCSKFVVSDNKDNLIDAFPICRKSIDAFRDKFVNNITAQTNALFASIQESLKLERVFLRSLFSRVSNYSFSKYNLNRKVRLDSLEMLTLHQKLLDWEDERQRLAAQFNKIMDSDNPLTTSFLDKLRIPSLSYSYIFPEYNTQKDNTFTRYYTVSQLEQFRNNGAFELSYIDLAIYLGECDVLEFLIREGAYEYTDIDAFVKICIENRNSYIFSHKIFPLQYKKENGFMQFIVDIVRNDFKYAIEKILQMTGKISVMPYVLYLSVIHKSNDIFSYILTQVNVNKDLIRILDGSRFGFRENIYANKMSQNHAILFSFIDIESTFTGRWSPKGSVYSILQFTSLHGNKEMVAMLLNEGADVNLVIRGQTAYDLISENKSKWEIQNILLSNGALSARNIKK